MKKENLRVISAYKGMRNYVETLKGNTVNEAKGLWNDYVIAPYWQQWAAGQFNEERIRKELEEPITDINKLSIAIEALEKFGVEEKIIKVYEKIENLLPSQEEEKAICIYINLDISENLHGVLGSCAGDNTLIQINPFIDNWNDYVPWVLAHEHHHSVWGYNYFFLKGNFTKDLLTSIIVEGQADSFGKYICPELEPKWVSALTLKEEIKHWSEMQDYLNSDEIGPYVRFIFGDKETNTPWCTGYTIGYHIIQSYIENNGDVEFQKMLNMDAKDILLGSKYGF